MHDTRISRLLRKDPHPHQIPNLPYSRRSRCFRAICCVPNGRNPAIRRNRCCGWSSGRPSTRFRRMISPSDTSLAPRDPLYSPRHRWCWLRNCRRRSRHSTGRRLCRSERRSPPYCCIVCGRKNPQLRSMHQFPGIFHRTTRDTRNPLDSDVFCCILHLRWIGISHPWICIISRIIICFGLNSV